MPTSKKSLFTQKIYSYLVAAQQWYLETPERSLDEAYKAALVIKAMEDEHFNGQKVAPESAKYGNSSMAYFQSELKKYLKIVRMRLTEFNISRSVFNTPNQTITKLTRDNGTASTKDSFAIQIKNNSSLVLEKLRFIDEVIVKYADYEKPSYSLVTPQNIGFEPISVVNQQNTPLKQLENKVKSKSEETNVLPRSIWGTIRRLQDELDPKAEQDIVKRFRNSQKRTLISVRFLLLLVIVPFLTHQLSKQIIVGPLVDQFRDREENAIFLNDEMEERAFLEMQRFEERIKFKNLLSSNEEISPLVVEHQMKERVLEIAQEFRAESSNAVKNVFSDLLALVAFICLLVYSKREIAVLKDFMDQIVYGLSDSAKAFIIILFTDMFVGFHSPHGWEVLLSNISRHLGVPENHDFIFLFIATFPVILDTIFKYWIFRYLNRVSPSAVATYRNMNE